MGVWQPWQAISIVLRSARNSRHVAQRRSGGLISLRRLLRFFWGGGVGAEAEAAAGVTAPVPSPSADGRALGCSGWWGAPSACAASFGASLTPAASWAAFVHVQVPVQLSVLQAIWRSSRSPSSFSQFSQYCG